MRYYSITVSSSPGGAPVQIPSANSGAASQAAFWTSHPNGLNGGGNPAAQDIEINAPVGAADSAIGAGAFVRIWGVPLPVLNNAQLLQNSAGQPRYLTLLGGMGPGLPLANPQQAGTLLVGTVQECFGNWQGSDMTLDFFLLAAPGTIDAPVNLTINWQPGQPLSAAVASMLSTVFPAMQQNIAIMDNLTNPTQHAWCGYYPTLRVFGWWLRQKTQAMVGGSYPGVRIWAHKNTITVSDFTNPPPQPTQLLFTDLVGQPTWIAPSVIQAKLVMRGDLDFGAQVTMPESFTNSAGLTGLQTLGPPITRQNVGFNGTYNIVAMYHHGRFRSPNGADWCSIVNLQSDQYSIAA